jgi:hypothetical protein
MDSMKKFRGGTLNNPTVKRSKRARRGDLHLLVREATKLESEQSSGKQVKVHWNILHL